MTSIILGIISLVCFVFLSLISKDKVIWKISFIVVFFLSAYNIYQNFILEKTVGEVKNRIESSNIQIDFVVTVNKDTQRDMNGRISSAVYTSNLKTESGNRLVYKSIPGSAILIRKKRKYSFSYRANLLPEDNIYRDAKVELINAKQIEITLIPFIKLIHGDIGTEVECKLTELGIKYFVNNDLVYEKDYVPNDVV